MGGEELNNEVVVPEKNLSVYSNFHVSTCIISVVIMMSQHKSGVCSKTGGASIRTPLTGYVSHCTVL
jgi:hypothetical protein